MQKQYRLRWKHSDSKELERAINRFNRKIARLEKANPELKGMYPERASYKWYREVISTRYDLKREIRALDKFSKPGMETLYDVGDDAKITKWQLSESNRRVKQINVRRSERLEKVLSMPKYASGQPLKYNQAQFGLHSEELRKLEPMKVMSDHPDQFDIKMKWRSIVRQSSKEYFTKSDYQWRDNYIKSLEENFGSEADELIAHIKSMPIDEYLEIAYGDIDSEIKFNYPTNFGESMRRIDQLYDIWHVNKSNIEELLDTYDAYANSFSGE